MRFTFLGPVHVTAFRLIYRDDVQTSDRLLRSEMTRINYNQLVTISRTTRRIIITWILAIMRTSE